MKKLLALALIAVNIYAHGQVSPLAGNYTATVELSTIVDKVDTSVFSPIIGMTWKNVTKREGVAVKVLDGLDKDGKTVPHSWVTYQGSATTPTFERGTMMFYPFVAAKAGTLDTKFTGAVETGKKWAAKYTIVSNPVAWCPSSQEFDFKADYTVGEKESFDLVIDGQKTTLSVLPIFENGWWTRCVSGRAVRKFLYSPDLNAHVSMEWAQYRPAPNNQDVSVSQMFKLLDLKKAN